MPLAAGMAAFPWSPWVKFPLAVGITILAGELLTLKVLRRLPGLRRVF